MGRVATKVDAEAVINDYVSSQVSVDDLAKKYHTGKVKIRKILNDSGVDRRKRGGQCKNKVYVVPDYHIEKYVKRDGFHFIARSKDGDYCTRDYMNNAGCLTSYIRERYGVDVPVLYERREYYKMTGNYWWEQWFDILEVADADVKRCPYCDWETKDVDNVSGAFEVHLLKKHGISKLDYLNEHPEDADYFRLVCKSKNLQMSNNEDEFVTCEICGKKFKRLDGKHLSSHGLTKYEYMMKFPNSKTLSNDFFSYLSQKMSETNEKMTHDFSSAAEREIFDFVSGLGFKCTHDRKILHGMELDVLVPEKMVAIEYNGNMWHSEKFGKDRQYHLAKLEKCNEEGIGLIQIFEDEYTLHKDLVLSKIKHILGAEDMNSERIPGRNCGIYEISNNEAQSFLDINHIQGFARSSVYLGAFYQNRLIGVMSFVNLGSGGWVLNRFATENGIICQGVGGKLFKTFIRKYSPTSVVSFADRRWTISSENNIYTKLGFSLYGVLQPEYHYYNPKVDKVRRFHKFNFRKNTLHRQYGLPLSMTELEMTRQLGFTRIWDCGLFKYVWRNGGQK